MYTEAIIPDSIAALYNSDLEPSQCSECPLWQPSDRTPNCGYCPVHEETTLGHNPAIGLCKLQFWDLVEAATTKTADHLMEGDRVIHKNQILKVRRSYPALTRAEGTHVHLVALDWKPLEDKDVLKVTRAEADSLTRVHCYKKRGFAVLTGLAMAMALAVVSIAPPAFAHRASGRIEKAAQEYTPPDNGGTESTQGAGTR